ncbi:hypothetical protein [Streptomyces boncukensis]|uniref:Uncharacterized protein n=1 Tax=Streptomyces boncukensis TaxID=2711219 RepID=A0A6G4WTR3_9ACTN|nr:hypothetical protein [Streptomyces boncukensis]NGO68030.1 hypothetical protein [Streptomyces boncukensis]
MQHHEITPDMHVRLAATGAPCRVLHTRTAPADAPESVFVYNHSDGSQAWIAAADLDDDRSMPALPVLLSVTDGTARHEHDRLFWYGGREYRVHSMWADGTGGCTVEHVAEDGTRTVVMREQRSHESAMSATVDAVTALRQIDGAAVEYVVEAQDSSVHELRMTHPEADELGRLHVPSPEAAVGLTDGMKSAIRRDRLSGKEHRRSIYQFAAYPVFADGWVGRPVLRRR